MKPKEKAKELVEKFVIYTDVKDNLGRIDHDLWIERNKKCALICVKELMELAKKVSGTEWEYWLEVKQEINKQ